MLDTDWYGNQLHPFVKYMKMLMLFFNPCTKFVPKFLLSQLLQLINFCGYFILLH